MPVEGQWRRANAPLGARDRRVLMIAAFLFVLGAAGGLGAYLTSSPSSSNAGCVVVTVPSTMGGAVLRRCGPAARTFCREQPRLVNASDQCRRLGYATGPARSHR